MLGYNIPEVYTTGISGGVEHGTNGNPNEDPRSWEKRIPGEGLQGRISEPNCRGGRLHEGYGYYPDKTALFEDLVGETASELLTRFKAAQDDYFDLIPEGRAKDSLELSTQHLHELVAFMYDHFDEFKLILCRAEGTGYADFIEVLVELEVDRSEEYYALLRKNGMLSGSMTRQLHHMITRAYFTAVCETIVHDMPREEAMKYVDELAVFFHSGWSGLLRLE